jgi:hypothetical protein
MSVPLPKPDSSADFYLLAILDEVRAIRAALEPVEPPPAPEPKARARKVAP